MSTSLLNCAPHNHGIFKSALGLKKDKILNTVYTLRGLVYVKKDENDEPAKIMCQEQLNQLFRSAE